MNMEEQFTMTYRLQAQTNNGKFINLMTRHSHVWFAWTHVSFVKFHPYHIKLYYIILYPYFSMT